VDIDGDNCSSREENNHDSMEQRLQNAREARGWAFEYDRAYSDQVTRSVEEEADKRMEDVAK
jgi:hypothetical protein